jgi:hypothetical protein
VPHIVLLIVLLAGCNRPVTSSEHHPIAGRPTKWMGAAGAGSVPPIASAPADPSEDILGRAVPTCLKSIGAEGSANERMGLALERCSQGLIPRLPPAGWKVAKASPSTIGEFSSDRPSCVRVLVVVSDAGQAARASIVDGRGRLLASTSGPNALLIPKDGPLCVASRIQLQIEFASTSPPSTGMIAVLESP